MLTPPKTAIKETEDYFVFQNQFEFLIWWNITHWHFSRGNYFFPNLFLLSCCIKHKIIQKKWNTLAQSKNISSLSQNVLWIFFWKKSEVFTFSSWAGPRKYFKRSQAERTVFPPSSCHNIPNAIPLSEASQSLPSALGWPDRDVAWVSIVLRMEYLSAAVLIQIVPSFWG